ncbi:MAG: phenylalanine--tRNA ligase subunit beta [Candidatus Iainarchaeum archaeon]|uniref:phenylalanine--tRNA ligase n=1 Tax=Candidatus Iainarchaeum sp. TaxID=3101447 RepID=A0A7T9DJA2_9ARCH|nr:MAG: phenylalanine--tRNA ligase subunit beta [Candidatus Diapherotrites archaeon]
MVMLETSLQNINGYMKKPLTITKLEETLYQMGLELEDANPAETKIDITAERADLVSTPGLARALNAFLGYTKGVPSLEKKKSDYKVILEKSVQPVRPYTAAFVVKNVRLDEEKLKEIIWVQEKLHATFARDRKKASIGIYPLSVIHWPISFKGMKPHEIKFQPLEMQTTLTGKEILEQHPKGKKYAHLLKDLPIYPVFMDAKNNVLSMPPIINSHTAGKVTEKDRELFVEVSGHYWPTQSAICDILALLFSDMGGEIYEVHVEFPERTISTPELHMHEHVLEVELVNQTLGTNLQADKIVPLLESMMYNVTKVNPKQITVQHPLFRADVLHPLDLVDDIARAYNYANLKPVAPEVYTVGGILPQTQFEDDVKSCLVGLGFQEVITWVLTSHEHHFAAFNREESEHVKLGMVKEQGLTMCRNMLYPETMRALLANRSKRLPFKLFEVGHVIVVDAKTDTGTRTRSKLCVVLAHATSSFTEMKAIAEAIARQIGVQATYSTEKLPGFIEGRTAKMQVGKLGGFMGEMHPEILQRLGIQVPVTILEMDLE